MYILDKVLYQICFSADIFSQSVACFLVFLAEQKFLIVMKFSVSVVSFMDYTFGVLAKESSPYQLDFLLCYLLGVLWLCILHLGLWSILN